MLVIVKSSPDTSDGQRGVKLARDMAADLLLLQNGVCFAQKERLDAFCGTVYVLDEDKRLRGIKDEDIEKDIRTVDYERIVALMSEADKVVGMF